jgi:DNA primase
MDLIELAKEVGLNLTRAGASYSSSCPDCGGKDRFIIWSSNKYWCRQCGKQGDDIQFCRDFLGMSYGEACKKLNLEKKNRSLSIPSKAKELRIVKIPPPAWQEKALSFTKWAHSNLMNSPLHLSMLEDRMLSIETIKKYQLGLCVNNKGYRSKDFFIHRRDWGLLEEFKSDGTIKKLWIPYGLVIPSFELCGQVIKLKIRRLEWQANDKLPKYVEVTGSMQKPSLFGYESHQPTVLVESEFDAMLIQQEACDLCSSIALGGAGKRADAATHEFLTTVPLILFALDFDKTGKKQYGIWRQNYPNLRAWPAPITKSPGDAFKKGVSIRQWIIDGISQYTSKF